MTLPLRCGLYRSLGEGVEDDCSLDVADGWLVASAVIVAGRASLDGAGAGLAGATVDQPLGQVGQYALSNLLDPPGGKSPLRWNGGRR